MYPPCSRRQKTLRGELSSCQYLHPNFTNICRSFGDQLVSFLSKLLSGFSKGYIWQTALLRMTEYWKISSDSCDIVGSIAINFRKAFDSLPHDLLITKIYVYGVDLSSYKIIAGYLHSRKERVKIDDKRSNWHRAEKLVPQGSILGSLLFNIFIGDIFFFITNCYLYNYFDDFVICCAGSIIQQLREVSTPEINK